MNNTHYALVVGINDYPSYKPLNGAIRDAEKFRDWLISPTGGVLPEGNCKMIRSCPNPVSPVQEEIDIVLEKIFDDIGNNQAERFYFYFSGHGLGESQTRTNLCLARWSAIRRNLALDAESYLDTIASSGKFSEIVFFMDCCRIRLVNAGGLSCSLGFAKPTNPPSTRIFKANATEIFTAAFESEINDASAITEVRGHFTQALIEGLNGGANISGAGVSAADLKNYLEINVPRIALESNHQQHPEVINGLGLSSTFGLPVLTGAVKVKIEFSDTRKNEVVLEGPSNVIDRFVPNGEPKLIELQSGLHVLSEANSGEMKYFRVVSGMENLNVKF